MSRNMLTKSVNINAYENVRRHVNEHVDQHFNRNVRREPNFMRTTILQIKIKEDVDEHASREPHFRYRHTDTLDGNEGT